jgi:nitrogen fixation NifU-like protein
MTLETAREILTAHSKSKRNGVFAPGAEFRAQMLNPVCGDQVEMRARFQDERVVDVGFAAKACAICTASASLLSEAANGWSSEKILSLRMRFEKLITAQAEVGWPEELEAFRSFEHLRVNPRRRACAILPWMALEKLIGSVHSVRVD